MIFFFFFLAVKQDPRNTYTVSHCQTDSICHKRRPYVAPFESNRPRRLHNTCTYEITSRDQDLHYM